MVHLALRLVYGFALTAILFTPFGVYHSRVEPYVVGSIWGFHLPVGFAALVLGILIISSPRIILARNYSFGATMVIVGLLLILFLYLSPKNYFINLIHGTSFSGGQIDIDYPIGNTVTQFLALFSIIVGLVARMIAIIKRKTI